MRGGQSADDDASAGYEGAAEAFIQARSGFGRSVVRDWAQSLPQGATVLDLGCGSGEPVTAALLEAGASVRAVDASPTLVAAFRRRFPHVPVVCENVLTSDFFGRRFDAAVAVGIVFLLPPDAQRKLLARVASVLVPGGRFLFTAPRPACSWRDVITGRESVSLGSDAYRSALAGAGMRVVGEREDEGSSHYWDAVKS